MRCDIPKEFIFVELSVCPLQKIAFEFGMKQCLKVIHNIVDEMLVYSFGSCLCLRAFELYCIFHLNEYSFLLHTDINIGSCWYLLVFV